MDGGRRHIDNSEAMRHNEELARKLQAYHERRSAEWPVYKRCIEKRNRMYERNAMLASQVQLAMARCNHENGEWYIELEGCSGFVPRKEDLNENNSHCESILMADNPLSALVFVAMSMTDQQRIELEEENKAWQEIQRVEEEYDRKIIKLSGFEW